jgi:hypothetical protein
MNGFDNAQTPLQRRNVVLLECDHVIGLQVANPGCPPFTLLESMKVVS